MTKHALPSRHPRIVGRYIRARYLPVGEREKEIDALRDLVGPGRLPSEAAEQYLRKRTDFFRRYAAASGVSPGDINADLDMMLLLFSEQDIDAAKAEHAADLARIEAERDRLMRRMKAGRGDAQYDPHDDLQRLDKANDQLRELRARTFNKEKHGS